MALPAEISTCLVTGTLLDDAGRPLQGTVQLTPSIPQLISATTKRLIRVATRTLRLDEDGYFEVPLIPSAESDVLPHGLVWTLTFNNDRVYDATTLDFIVPSFVDAVDVSECVIAVSQGEFPIYLVGFQGPPGPPGPPGPVGGLDATQQLLLQILNYAAIPVVHGTNKDMLRPPYQKPVIWFGVNEPTNANAAYNDVFVAASVADPSTETSAYPSPVLYPSLTLFPSTG